MQMKSKNPQATGQNNSARERSDVITAVLFYNNLFLPFTC